MKRFLTLCVMAFAVLWSMPACGCGGEEADLVFINDSDTAIVTVAVDFEGGSEGSQHADSSPLRRGESFGFEVGKYPVTVLVYGTPVQNIVPGELGSITLEKAPPKGERWYVTAWDGGEGLVFSTVSQ